MYSSLSILYNSSVHVCLLLCFPQDNYRAIGAKRALSDSSAGLCHGAFIAVGLPAGGTGAKSKSSIQFGAIKHALDAAHVSASWQPHDVEWSISCMVREPCGLFYNVPTTYLNPEGCVCSVISASAFRFTAESCKWISHVVHWPSAMYYRYAPGWCLV